MQTTSELYLSILADPSHLKEHRLFIAGVEYDHSRILGAVETPHTWLAQKLQVTGGLFSKGRPAVGCCVSRQVDLMVLPWGDIPRMAEIHLETRLILREPLTGEITSASEWLPKGTFFIDTRRPDKVTGVLTIHGYDAMLKMEQPYLEDGADLDEWPKSMPVVMEEIALRIGVELDERNVLNPAYMVEAPADYTMREVAGYIAAAHGGNWTITDAGKLRLVPLFSAPADGAGEPVVGNAAADLTIAPAFDAYTGVTLWYDDELAYQAGDDTGRRLEADCPWATQAMAEDVLAAVSGRVYQPYAASCAVLDPAAELGDGVTIGSVYGLLAAVATTFDALAAADIAAPADEEIDHEYPYLTKYQRELARKVTLGKDYFGTRISKAKGLEIVKKDANGTEKSRVVLNSDRLAFLTDTGSEALYFDPTTGRYKFVGDIVVAGNINMAGGSITWGNNKPSGGISESRARTIISDELVSSPNIAGGKFLDLNQTTWLEMGTPTDTVAYLMQYSDLYESGGDPVVVMGFSGTNTNPNWVLAPFFNIALNYLETNKTMYAMGNWNFSNADVTGLPESGGGDVTVTPVWG